MVIFPERVPSMRASQRVFCFWVFAVGPFLRLPAQEVLPLLAVFWGCVHLTSMRPFSWGLEHWYIITKKPMCCICPQMPSKTSSPFTTIWFSPYSGHNRLIFKSVLSCGRWAPHTPILTATTACECSFASGVSEVWSQWWNGIAAQG